MYELVLQAVGRTPNGKKISVQKAGVAVTERGFINVAILMRTNVPPKRSVHSLWVMLIARVSDVFSLRCTYCGGQMDDGVGF